MSEADQEPTPDGSNALRPGASIDEIQARVAHLSDSGAEARLPGDTLQQGSSEAATGWGEVPPPARKPRKVLRAVLGGGTAVAVGVGILAAKFGLKLFAVGVAAAALSGAFGGRYDQLPSDQREAFEQRYDQAVGSSLDGLSDSERSARLDDLVASGASRLDDESLVLWTQLDAKAHAATDVGTCAQIARGWFTNDPDPAAVSAAGSKSYESLSIDDFGRIIDLNLKAMEAEKAGSPAVRSVTDATIEPVFTALASAMPDADNATVDAMLGGQTVTDAQACSALRALDAAADNLPPAQFASWAVWTSTP